MKRTLSLLLAIALLTPMGSSTLFVHGKPARSCAKASHSCAACTMERGTHHCGHCSPARVPAGSCALRDDGCGGAPTRQTAVSTGSLFHDAALVERANAIAAPVRERRSFAASFGPAAQRAPDHTDPPPKGAPTES